MPFNFFDIDLWKISRCILQHHFQAKMFQAKI